MVNLVPVPNPPDNIPPSKFSHMPIVQTPEGFILFDDRRDIMESRSHYNRFDVERKSNFLRLGIEFWPNLTKIAKAVGIDRATVHLHRNSDPLFRQAIKELDEMICDDLEGKLREEGMKKSFLDRIAYLKAHRPHLYNPAKVVKIEGYKMSDGERNRRMIDVDQAVDAEVTKSYLDRKERQGKLLLNSVNNNETPAPEE